MLVSKSITKKFKNAGFYIVNSICYTLVVFCTPNFITAFLIEVKEDTISENKFAWSKLFMVGTVIMFIVTHFLSLTLA